MINILIIVGYILVGILAAGIANGLRCDGDAIPLVFLFWPVMLVAGIVGGVLYGIFALGNYFGELFK